MTPFWFDIEVPRNGSDFREYQLVDATGAAMDITGWTITAQARDAAGGTVIATATVALVEPTNGTFSAQWIGSQFDAYGDVMGLATAAIDIKAVAGSLPIALTRGTLYITTEVTA
ncbi:MAG: hypothetical protein A3E01_09190 [Gammaproteobacteria bacterium RIFCSPHIGHO2_12_FULL_63_22]|nr:MAG: hypothetical protein A3E01_09190 [Gammaproteobacteria bacterium RIFCSPHIGHO2_12_FULL_63_22]